MTRAFRLLAWTGARITLSNEDGTMTMGRRRRTIGGAARRLAVGMVALLAACASPGSRAEAPGTGTASRALEGTEWALASLDGAAVTVPSGWERPTLRLADGRAEGTTGCNRFSGSYELSGDRLTFGPAAATRRACPGDMGLEASYLRALEATDRYTTSGDRLTLYDGERAVAEFRPGA